MLVIHPKMSSLYRICHICFKGNWLSSRPVLHKIKGLSATLAAAFGTWPTHLLKTSL